MDVPGISAKASGVNFEGNEANLSANLSVSPTVVFQGGERSLEPKGVERFLRLMNPVRYEEREAEARAIQTQSFIDSVKSVRESLPFATEQRAVMEALGYRMSNEQADNMMAAIDGAQGVLDRAGGNIRPLTPEIRDAIVDGAKSAYDDEARKIWSRLIAEEASSSGSFSKRTVSILSNMSRNEVDVFRRFCSYCIPNELPLAVLHPTPDDGGGFNGGAFTYEMRNVLESIGLINCGTRSEIRVPAKRTMLIRFNGNDLAIENPREVDAKLSFSPVVTEYGIELSTLCSDDIGTAPDIAEYITLIAKKQGFVIPTLGCEYEDGRDEA